MSKEQRPMTAIDALSKIQKILDKLSEQERARAVAFLTAK
jgi:hypothetical protein